MIVLDDIPLEDFVWLNSVGYSPFVATQEFSLDGSQQIELGEKQAGQSILLFSEAESFATYIQLQNHANAQGSTPFELEIHGTTYNVMWDYLQQPVTGEPAQNFSDAAPDEAEQLTLNLITV